MTKVMLTPSPSHRSKTCPGSTHRQINDVHYAVSLDLVRNIYESRAVRCGSGRLSEKTMRRRKVLGESDRLSDPAAGGADDPAYEAVRRSEDPLPRFSVSEGVDESHWSHCRLARALS